MRLEHAGKLSLPLAVEHDVANMTFAVTVAHTARVVMEIDRPCEAGRLIGIEYGTAGRSSLVDLIIALAIISTTVSAISR